MASIPGRLDDSRALEGGRMRWVLVLLAAGLFTAGGVLVFLEAPGGRVGGIVVFGFFGLCTLAAALHLANGSRLVLSRDGFTVNAFFGRRVLRRWDTVGEFYVIRPSLLLQMVAFSPPTGFGMGALPDTYGMKAGEFAALMNEWRDRYRSRSDR